MFAVVLFVSSSFWAFKHECEEALIAGEPVEAVRFRVEILRRAVAKRLETKKGRKGMKPEHVEEFRMWLALVDAFAAGLYAPQMAAACQAAAKRSAA